MKGSCFMQDESHALGFSFYVAVGDFAEDNV